MSLAYRLLNEMNYRNSFEEMINSIETVEFPVGGFSYRNKAIKLHGREEEFSALDRFLAADQPVLFWAVTAPAGAGKSKFVYEYVRRKREDPNWMICYLENDAGHLHRICDFTSWEYPINLLLVVDYAGSCAEYLYQWFLALQDARKKKLRILLIERQGVSEDERGNTIEPNWYFRLHGSKTIYSDRGRRVFEKKYKDSKYPHFLIFRAIIGKSDFFLIMVMIRAYWEQTFSSWGVIIKYRICTVY
jgi:hypothetical protein